MTGPEVRASLAMVVAGAVPPEWTVYAGLPEVVSLPAVVIATTSTRRADFGACDWLYAMRVDVLEARPGGTTAYDSVEVMAATVRDALFAVPSLAWEETVQGPMIAPGGVEAFGATLTISVYA